LSIAPKFGKALAITACEKSTPSPFFSWWDFASSIKVLFRLTNAKLAGNDRHSLSTLHRRVQIWNSATISRPAIRAILSVLEDVQDLEVCALASNGRGAIDAAHALKPDLLIVDQVMPGLSGLEVIGILKTSLPKAKFILFTMYEDSITKVLTRFAGVDVVIEKSKGLMGLTDKIRSVMAEIKHSKSPDSGQCSG